MVSLCGFDDGRGLSSGRGSFGNVSSVGADVVIAVVVASRASFGSVRGSFTHCHVLQWPSLPSIPPHFVAHFRSGTTRGKCPLDFRRILPADVVSPLRAVRLTLGNPALGPLCYRSGTLSMLSPSR